MKVEEVDYSDWPIEEAIKHMSNKAIEVIDLVRNDDDTCKC